MQVIALAGCQLMSKEGLVCGESGGGREESPGLSFGIAVRNYVNNIFHSYSVYVNPYSHV